MKKNHAPRPGPFHPVVHNLLRIVKLSFCCFLLMSFSVSGNGFSQDVKVTLSIRNVKLAKMFKMIEKQTEYRFAFSNDIIPEKVRLVYKPTTCHCLNCLTMHWHHFLSGTG